jgi:hypothetical protein
MDGGQVRLDVSDLRGHAVAVRWLDIGRSAWSDPAAPPAGQPEITLQAPGPGFHLALVTRVRR